eukprot:gb/GECH01008580.1/.p1 GENE.gb/GECH01008580.1/~~gb/GECH01008580.1/.p1  ORF type:complete len:454 (+),score=34.32 gb/GECH01008580.1/:1-1362(+)
MGGQTLDDLIKSDDYNYRKKSKRSYHSSHNERSIHRRNRARYHPYVDKREKPKSKTQKKPSIETQKSIENKRVELEDGRERIMNYSEEELSMRRRHFGSTLSIIDRRKFDKEFDHSKLLEKLTPEEKNVYEENPHIQQVFANRRQFVRPGRQLKMSDRVVTKETPRSKYKRRQGEAKTVEHWGQRKLLMSEIEFLSEYSKPGMTVLYAGAAPGDHTNFLQRDMFPQLKFVLVDPARFSAYSVEGKVEIINDYFDDHIARRYAEREDILFISDVRSMDVTMSEKEKERHVVSDMEAQMRWHKIIKPEASMLKFRLPYPPPERQTEYLDGYMYLPVWGGRTTTETRLIVTKDHLDPSTKETRTRLYSHVDYESVMFHFNTVTRTMYFEHNVDGEGLDHCFDCSSEILILSRYLQKIHDIQQDKELRLKVGLWSKLISRHISSKGRTLELWSSREV